MMGLLWSFNVSAHKIGLSRGAYTVKGKDVQAEWTFAKKEIESFIPELKGFTSDSNSVIQDKQVLGKLSELMVSKVEVLGPAKKCPSTLQKASITNKKVKQSKAPKSAEKKSKKGMQSADDDKRKDALTLQVHFRCPQVPKNLKLNFEFFPILTPGHRHIAMFDFGAIQKSHILFRNRKQLELKVLKSQQAKKGKKKVVHELGYLFIYGMEHILFGWDHLAFLLALFLLGGSAKTLFWIITAFTLSHSITLGLSSFGIFVVSGSIIEPAIALSIVYTAGENFFLENNDKRWILTFLFGFIHGFGLAGALVEAQLPANYIPMALLSFNLGIEAAQLIILLLMLPILHYLRKQAWFENKGFHIVNILLILAGLGWFFQRILS